jgi:hypothetical protein
MKVFNIAIFSSSATLSVVNENWPAFAWVIIAASWWGMYMWEKGEF